MKVHYSKDEDILMIQLTNKKVDDAYETKNMIIHVSEDKEPVLLEIFNASEFIKKATQDMPKKVKQEIINQSVSVAHQIKK